MTLSDYVSALRERTDAGTDLYGSVLCYFMVTSDDYDRDMTPEVAMGRIRERAKRFQAAADRLASTPRPDAEALAASMYEHDTGEPWHNCPRASEYRLRAQAALDALGLGDDHAGA